MDKRLARSIARISGDGSISTRQVMYFNHCEVLMEEFVADMQIMFHKSKFSRGIMSSGVPYVAFYGRRIVELFESYLPSYKSANIYVPLKVLKAEKEVLFEYLQAFYDDEGCASLRLNKKTQ